MRFYGILLESWLSHLEFYAQREPLLICDALSLLYAKNMLRTDVYGLIYLSVFYIHQF